MVSTSRWEQLSEDEKSEYKTYSSKFIRAVCDSDARDGYEFSLMYSIQLQNGSYFIAKENTDEPLAGITSQSKKVIETLFADAAQNYDR